MSIAIYGLKFKTKQNIKYIEIIFDDKKSIQLFDINVHLENICFIFLQLFQFFYGILTSFIHFKYI